MNTPEINSQVTLSDGTEAIFLGPQDNPLFGFFRRADNPDTFFGWKLSKIKAPLKTFNYFWKFSGLRDWHNRGTIQARNLPEALTKLAEREGFRISGQALKRNGNRRIKFFGRTEETGTSTSAPLVEGVVANA